MKNWNVKFVAGNPDIFKKVITDASSPMRRSKALEKAEILAGHGWRSWVENKNTGERIFESQTEQDFKLQQDIGEKTMKLDKYISSKNTSKFLFVETGVDPKNLSFPDNVDTDFLEVQFLNTTPDLQSGDKPIGGDDLDEILTLVQENGFAFLGATK